MRAAPQGCRPAAPRLAISTCKEGPATNPDIAYRRLAYALRNPMEGMSLLRASQHYVALHGDSAFGSVGGCIGLSEWKQEPR